MVEPSKCIHFCCECLKKPHLEHFIWFYFKAVFYSFQNASLVWHVTRTCLMTSLSWMTRRTSTVQMTGPRKRPTGVQPAKGQLYLRKDKQMLQGLGPSERIIIRIASNARYFKKYKSKVPSAIS